jgi:Probable metallopeptidase family (DUF6775)
LKISKIILYNESILTQIHLEKLPNFLKEFFTVEVELRKTNLILSKKDIALKIASCRIENPKKPFEKHSPSEQEILEEWISDDTDYSAKFIMYDGFELQNVLTELIPENESTLEYLHVFFTNKLTCTFDLDDCRYHGRALIAANPSILSISGMIEAPAKPREYYLDLIENFDHDKNLDLIKQKYQGTYLEYDDSRLSKIIEGYILQAIFYYETGNPFCQKPNCMLFNAHWQRDLLHSQIECAKLCDEHNEIMNKMFN